MAKPIGEPIEDPVDIDGFYKGYDIKWLAKEEQKNHPDRYLVEEFDRKAAK